MCSAWETVTTGTVMNEGEKVAYYDVAGRDSITQTGTVYATYAYDPKTAPDSPRGVLMNSNVIKISISDT